MAYAIEKDWITKAGFRAVVIIVQMEFAGKTYNRHRCGYVGINSEHPYYMSDYDNLDIDCHGGLTFSSDSDRENYPVKSNLHWIGFDCAHVGDAAIDSDIPYYYSEPNAVVRDLDFCIQQCESIASQLLAAETQHTGD